MRLIVALGLLWCGTAAPAFAQADNESGARVTVRTSIKGTGLGSWPISGSETEPNSAESMFRLRIEPEMRPRENTTLAFAYEQRFRYQSTLTGLASIGILPSDSSTPFRVRPLAWTIKENATAAWRHELDRANAQLHLPRADITIGRQAIGWGRGVLFTAVDLFAPFSPLEVDREWRPGVDAVRGDIKLTERSSLDLVGAFGRTIEASAFAGRARGFAGPIDVEVMGGRRARDLFAGVTTSAAVGDAELHAEVAAFRVPSDDIEDHAHALWKAVVGGSYRFPIGSGILAYAEYHYSGFGAARLEEMQSRFATQTFVERYLRGDLQILSRHAVGVTASYEASPEVSWSGQWLHNPVDRSGIVAPGMTYTFGDAVSLLAAIYLPYGRPVQQGVLRSEFGGTPLSALLQLRLYF